MGGWSGISRRRRSPPAASTTVPAGSGIRSKTAPLVYARLQGFPDDILGLYDNWADSSFCPQVGVGYRRRSEKKQGDPPLAKPGVIGAFSRVYSITEAIVEFLPDKYAAGETDKRYSLVGAPTTNGLVVYDNDLFAFSNHATDLCSNRLVSAFDLVRLHKFVQLDEEAKEDTPFFSLPSSIEMRQVGL